MPGIPPPPPPPVPPVVARGSLQTLYLLHFNGNIVDDVAANTWVYDGPQPATVSSAQARFGSAALTTSSPANRGIITITGAVGGAGVGTFNQFCVDSWLYYTASPTDASSNNQRIVLGKITFADGIVITITATGRVIGSQFGTLNASNGFIEPPLNTWQHIRTTYDGSYLRVFVNGVCSVDSASPNPGAQKTNAATNLTVVGPAVSGLFDSYTDFGFSSAGLAYVDESRFTIGDYLTNSDFSPPTAPFTIGAAGVAAALAAVLTCSASASMFVPLPGAIYANLFNRSTMPLPGSGGTVDGPFNGFKLIPDRGADRTISTAVRTEKFNGNFEQNRVEGINSVSESWSLAFTLRKRSEIELIDALFTSLNGRTSFPWTTPLKELKNFKCVNWDSTYYFDGNASLTCTLEQTFP